MKNELLSIGSFTIYGYGLMIAIGVLAAYFTAEYRAKKLKLNPDKIFYLTLWALAGGISGAKILYYITDFKHIVENPSLLLNFGDGFVVYGGIIGGIIAGFLYCKVAKIEFLKYFDLALPSVALAQGFGRIGCFLAGCCYGIETSGPFNIVFHESHFAPNGVPLLPTQLISSGLNFLNFFVLIYFAKRKKADGQVAALYLIFYSIGRFILEFFRGDLIRGSVGRWSTSQFISIFIVIFGIAVYIISAKKASANINKENQD
jgi:phosphatidylglycerol:prolipoprotein diacylglycerol transferase